MDSGAAALRTTRIFWLLVPFAGVVTWGVHEAGHFLMGRSLGYDMWMSMNRAGPVDGDYTSTRDRVFVAMAGPLVTYLQAGIALWAVRARGSSLAYAFLFLAFFMRLTAFAVGISNPNDEARASLDLGLPAWVLPSIACSILLGMTVAGSRRLRVGWRTNTLLYLAASTVAAAIVFGDPVVGRLVG